MDIWLVTMTKHETDLWEKSKGCTISASHEHGNLEEMITPT